MAAIVCARAVSLVRGRRQDSRAPEAPTTKVSSKFISDPQKLANDDLGECPNIDGPEGSLASRTECSFEARATELAHQSSNFRSDLLGKLAYQGSWQSREQRNPTHRTVTIFDWDDTLLCTGEITSGCLEARPSSRRSKQLRCLAVSAKRLLEAALVEGPTYIITNASEGWVEQSCRRFLPELAALLPRVRVISARTRFEALSPKCPEQWKIRAFLEVSATMDRSTVTNLLAIGDSFAEIRAAEVMGSDLPGAVVKTVKLCEDPTVEDLCAQHSQLLHNFRKIVDHASHSSMHCRRQSRRHGGRAESDLTSV